MCVYPNYYKYENVSSHKYEKQFFISKYKYDKFIIGWIKTNSTN